MSTVKKIAMCIVFITGFLMIGGAGPSTQEAPRAIKTVSLIPHWKKGEVLKYDLIKTRQKVRGKQVILTSTTRSEVAIEVLQTDKDIFTLAWTQGETKFDDPKQANNPIVRRVLDVFKDQRIVLDVDGEGVIQKVRNWQELQKNSQKMLDLLLGELKTAGQTPEMIAKLRDQLSFLFSDEEKIRIFCAKNPNAFLFTMGAELTQGEPIELDSELENPFGGDPFPAMIRIALEDVDEAKKTAHISYSQTFIPEQVRPVMEKTLKELTEKLGKSAPGLPTNFSIRDDGKYVVDIDTGWVREFTYKRSAISNEISQDDILTMKRKPQ